MTGQFSANASALGYYYQARYALHLLLRADSGAEMYLERFDDISFHKSGTPAELLQTKHHKKGAGSLTDKSTDLWKTLRVWIEAMLAGSLRPAETVLSIVTTSVAPDGSAASKLRPAGTQAQRDVDGALKLLEDALKASDNRTNRPAYDAFLKLDDTQRRALIGSVQVLDASPDITDARDLILKEMRLTVREKFLPLVFERVEGWWFGRVVSHLAGDSNTPILSRELRDHLHNVQEQYFDESLPIEFLDAIGPDEDKLGEAERVFVEQLRLIMVSTPRIRRAINNYYRAFQQRSKWAREDLLHVGELDEYETQLIAEWENRHDIMKENLGEGAAEEIMQREGRALFNWVDTEADIRIRRNVTEPYVVRGSYHILASQLRVGWHCEFLKRLSHLLAPAR